MKQLLYFISGFLISFVFITQCYTQEIFYQNKLGCDDYTLPMISHANYIDQTMKYYDSFPPAFLSDGGLYYHEETITGVDSNLYIYRTCDSPCTAPIQWKYIYFTYLLPGNPNLPVGTGGTGCYDVFPPQIDSDNDGIPDYADMYPNDSSRYKYTITSAIEDEFGNIVFMTIRTDRGDYFNFGVEPSDMTNYQNVVYIAPSYQDDVFLQTHPLLGGGGTEYTTLDNSEYSKNLQDYVNQDIPLLPVNSDSNMIDSTPSTGSETDNEALRGILSNTDSTSKNISRLGDYLKSMNKSLHEINKNKIYQQVFFLVI